MQFQRKLKKQARFRSNTRQDHVEMSNSASVHPHRSQSVPPAADPANYTPNRARLVGAATVAAGTPPILAGSPESTRQV